MITSWEWHLAVTEDPAHDELTDHVKEWIKSRHMSIVDLADILSSFPDISVALTEDIVEKLLKEGLISKAGKDSDSIIKELSPNICAVKEEVEMQETPHAEKIHKNVDEDYMYMKTLYHALPMVYVTVAKLHSKLDGEANQNTVCKLIAKMSQDSYLENSGSRRLGK